MEVVWTACGWDLGVCVLRYVGINEGVLTFITAALVECETECESRAHDWAISCISMIHRAGALTWAPFLDLFLFCENSLPQALDCRPHR